jgi:hypothetical protein
MTANPQRTVTHRRAACVRPERRPMASVHSTDTSEMRNETALDLRVYSGDGGIRTHGTVAGPTVFKTVPFVRSGTSPGEGSVGGGAGPSWPGAYRSRALPTTPTAGTPPAASSRQ